MGISDDLSTLFNNDRAGVRFRQGTILSWDQNTGANAVDVAGSTLTNLPILNTGEAIALRAGFVVGLLGQDGTWFIIGRITPPGDPSFAGASVAFAGIHASATNFSLSTSAANKVTASIPVPSWADEAVVQLTSTVSVFNGGATGSYTVFQPFIDGNGGGGGGFGLAPVAHTSFNDSNSTGLAYQRVLTSLGATISLAVTGLSTPALAAVANNTIILDGTAIFRSVT